MGKQRVGFASPRQIVWGVVILVLGIIVGKAIVDISSYNPDPPGRGNSVTDP